MIGDAFLLDAADPSVAARHFRDHWLPRLDELDEASLERAARSLDRAAYVTEQAANKVKARLRARALERAAGVDSTVGDA